MFNSNMFLNVDTWFYKFTHSFVCARAWKTLEGGDPLRRPAGPIVSEEPSDLRAFEDAAERGSRNYHWHTIVCRTKSDVKLQMLIRIDETRNTNIILYFFFLNV